MNPSTAPAEAPEDPAADHERIVRALARLRGVFEARPEAARSEDAPATATLARGMRFVLSGPEGQAALADMPSTAGGGGAAPTPGWLMRAAFAACTATVIRMMAAERGIVLDTLEVTVRSRSDYRGLLRMDGVSAAMADLCTEVRLGAAGADPEVLREIAQCAQRDSPIAATLAQGSAGALEIVLVD